MKRLYYGLCLLFVTALLVTACKPEVIVQTQDVVKTVIVTQVVEGEVQELVVTATPQPTKDVSQEPVTLRFPVWTSNEGQLGVLKELAEEYKAIHPNVSVEYISLPFDEYTTKVTIQLAGGNPPDVGWLVENNAQEWIDAGVLADLRPAINKYPDYDFADISESALSLWVRGDAVYGIPFSNSPEFILYNKDLFEAAGIPSPEEMIASGEWTWENLAKSAKAIKESGPQGTYGFLGMSNVLYTTNPWWTIVPIIRAYGGDVWNAEGTECQLNKPEAVQAIQFLHDMIFKDGSVVPPGEMVEFNSGRVGMTISRLSSISREMPDVTFEWGIAPFPSGPAGAAQIVGQGTIVAYEASKHRDIATDFVVFLTTKENFTKMAQFWPPSRASVLSTDVIEKANPQIRPDQIQLAIAESIKTGYVLPVHMNFAKIDLAVRGEFDNLWKPDADVQSVLDTACEVAALYLK